MSQAVPELAEAESPSRLARRVRVPVVSRTPGRLRDPPLGHYDPCARCSLTAPVHRGDKRGPELSECPRHSREPQRSAERRARPASWAGRSRAILRSVRPRGGPRVRRSAPAPVGALPPRLFERSRRRTKGNPPPPQRVAQRGLRPRHSGAERSEEPGIHNHKTGEWNADGATRRVSWLWIPGPALARRPGMTAAEETGHCRAPSLAPRP